MHSNKKYVITSYGYYYLKERKYVFESKEKVKTYTPPIPYRVPKRQASIPALHLTCTLCPEKSQTLLQTTFLTKIGDHALLITGQARVLQRLKGPRKKARKRPPRRNTWGRRKAKNLHPQVGLEAPGLAHQAEGVLATDLSEQHATAAHHACEGRVFPPAEAVLTEVRRCLFTSPPTTAAILCSHAFLPPPVPDSHSCHRRARAGTLGNMRMRNVMPHPHPLRRAEVEGGALRQAE